jgi:hypothetical protein
VQGEENTSNTEKEGKTKEIYLPPPLAPGTSNPVLTTSSMALPNAGPTRTVRRTGLLDTLQERHRAVDLRTTVAAGGDQPAPALYEDSQEVALAANNLGHPKVEVHVASQDNGDVARWQGRQTILLRLYEVLTPDKSKRKKRETVR